MEERIAQAIVKIAMQSEMSKLALSPKKVFDSIGKREVEDARAIYNAEKAEKKVFTGGFDPEVSKANELRKKLFDKTNKQKRNIGESAANIHKKVTEKRLDTETTRDKPVQYQRDLRKRQEELEPVIDLNKSTSDTTFQAEKYREEGFKNALKPNWRKKLGL